MTNRFVVLLDSATKEQEEAVRLYVEGRLNWWHWLPNSWLVTDPTGRLTAVELRDAIKTILPTNNMLVLEFTDSGYTWAGAGPNKPPRDMFEWIRKNWGNTKQPRPS